MTEGKIIDVLAVIDADTIVARYGENADPGDPAEIAEKDLVRVIVQTDNVGGGSPGSPLIKVTAADVIRWRESSLSLNTDCSAVCYEVAATSATKPEALVVTVDTPVADPEDPLAPEFQSIRSHLWDCMAEKTASVTYSLKFVIMDKKGRALGYYLWRPFPEVENLPAEG